MIPHDTIEQLTDTWAAITATCTGLSGDQWAAPTDCPGWSVQDNLSHMVATERLLQGLPAADHPIDMPEYVKNPIGEFNEREVDARRHLPGDAVLDEWREVTALRLATFAVADEEYFDAPAMTPTGAGTVADFLSIRVLDCWSHEQDIRRAVHRPGGLDTAAAGHTVDRLIGTLPIVVGKRARCPEGSAVVMHITGPVQRSVTVEITGGRAHLVAAPTHPPLVTITLDTETFVLLALGRRRFHDLGGQQATIDGDIHLGRAVLANLAMMI